MVHQFNTTLSVEDIVAEIEKRFDPVRDAACSCNDLDDDELCPSCTYAEGLLEEVDTWLEELFPDNIITAKGIGGMLVAMIQFHRTILEAKAMTGFLSDHLTCPLEVDHECEEEEEEEEESD